MLRRIAREDVRLGMYIHGFEGSWLSHPFWRSRFLLEDAEDLARVRASAIGFVLIDDAKGGGVPGEPVRPGADRMTPSRGLPTRVRPERRLPSGEPNDRAAGERARARRLVGRSQKVMRDLLDGVRLGHAIRGGDVLALVDEITGSIEADPRLFIGMIRLKSKDQYTYLHSVAVCALMLNLARQIGLDPALHRPLGIAGLLHDVGKMCVPDTILNKPGSLDEAEFELMRRHPTRGHALLLEGEAVPAQALDVCLHHHERLDGRGYPAGLSGDGISLAARMGAICDVYDALTSERAYKAAWSPQEAVTAMHGWTGQFDGALLFAFCRSIGVYPIGHLVRLRSNRLAVVMAGGRDETPRARAFYSIMDRAVGRYEDVTITDDLRGDQIVGEEFSASWGLTGWSGLRERILSGLPPAPEAG